MTHELFMEIILPGVSWGNRRGSLKKEQVLNELVSLFHYWTTNKIYNKIQPRLCDWMGIFTILLISIAGRFGLRRIKHHRLFFYCATCGESVSFSSPETIETSDKTAPRSTARCRTVTVWMIRCFKDASIEFWPYTSQVETLIERDRIGAGSSDWTVTLTVMPSHGKLWLVQPQQNYYQRKILRQGEWIRVEVNESRRSVGSSE